MLTWQVGNELDPTRADAGPGNQQWLLVQKVPLVSTGCLQLPAGTVWECLRGLWRVARVAYCPQPDPLKFALIQPQVLLFSLHPHRRMPVNQSMKGSSQGVVTCPVVLHRTVQLTAAFPSQQWATNPVEPTQSLKPGH